MKAGYSETPLRKKLGIEGTSVIKLVNAPENYFSLLRIDISDQLCKPNEVPDLVHLFATSQKQFQSEMKKLSKLTKQNRKLVIWISWYKKSARIPTDLTEDAIRNFALQNDLVDVKVCAVSDIWSGLKLVVPLAKRK